MLDQSRKAGARTVALQRLAQSMRELETAVNRAPDVLPSAKIRMPDEEEVKGYFLTSSVVFSDDGKLYWGRAPAWKWREIDPNLIHEPRLINRYVQVAEEGLRLIRMARAAAAMTVAAV